jgi:tol-pal system protein YbgF
MKAQQILACTACTVLLAASTACVMPDQLSQIQKDMADVRQQLREVQQDQAGISTRLDQLQDAASADQERITRAELADLAVRVDQVGRDVNVTDERLSDLGRRVDRLAQEIQQARAHSAQRQHEAAPPATTAEEQPISSAAEAVPDPEALYNTAYADFSKGNYALAISGFEEYREKFPDSALADNALYWVGECHFSQGDFQEAIRAFDRLLELHPESDKAAAGNLKKGLGYLEQNQIAQAIVQLRFVHSTYPGSDEAKIARDKLISLGAPI